MIKGLTDRPACFPMLGTLRKGGVKLDPKRPGADLDHFRFETKDDGARQIFQTVYGEQPRSVRIFMPFASLAENFEAWREEWSAGSLIHRCDGATCVRWRNGKNYSTEPVPCPGKCKPSGRLKVIIPDLKRMAYVAVVTTSIHDILTINENLLALESLRGDLRGIPLLLRRVEREISTPTDEGRARRKKWLLMIEAQPQWVELQLQATQQAALPTAAPLLLGAGEDEEHDDSGELEQTPAESREITRSVLLDRFNEEAATRLVCNKYGLNQHLTLDQALEQLDELQLSMLVDYFGALSAAH